MAKRGELTPAIAREMKRFLGRDGTEQELRLYPYLLYVMVNERALDPNKLNGGERSILGKLREDGHIEGGAAGMAMTKDFFIWANGLVFDSYSAFDNHEPPPALPADVARLVVVARKVAFEDQGAEALKELDQASEAFADRLDWSDQPEGEE